MAFHPPLLATERWGTVFPMAPGTKFKDLGRVALPAHSWRSLNALTHPHR